MLVYQKEFDHCYHLLFCACIGTDNAPDVTEEQTDITNHTSLIGAAKGKFPKRVSSFK